MKDLFFYLVDFFLPREIALWPYTFAYLDFSKKLNLVGNVQSWYRNSCKRKNIVFGISDLDITILINKNSYDNINACRALLSIYKKKYPFWGEVNFYLQDELLFFNSSLNYYEKKRDPELAKFLPSNIFLNLKVEKIVFLLRMLYSDRKKLLTSAYCRQKKWNVHFKDLNLPCSKNISFQTVVLEILKLFEEKDQPFVMDALQFLKSSHFSEENIFHQKTPLWWKFLFPHKHLWIDDFFFPEDENNFLKLICLRQIDWEIWGIMSQLPFIPKEDKSIEIHMTRLLLLAKNFKDSSGIEKRIHRLINLSKNDLLK